MYKIAVIGEKDIVFGFKSMGAFVFYANNQSEAKEQLKLIANQDYVIVFILEHLYTELSTEIKDLGRKYSNLAIVPIPSHKESLGVGMDNLKRIVEKAVGSSSML